MGRPSPILLWGADLAENLAFYDALPCGNSCQGVSRKVAVQSEELLRGARRVLYDYNRPVVKRGRVVRDRVNRAIEWCVNIGSWGNEKIDSKVNCAALVGRVAATAEQW